MLQRTSSLCNTLEPITPCIPFPAIETQTFLIWWHQSLKSSSVWQKKPCKKKLSLQNDQDCEQLQQLTALLWGVAYSALLNWVLPTGLSESEHSSADQCNDLLCCTRKMTETTHVETKGSHLRFNRIQITLYQKYDLCDQKYIRFRSGFRSAP